MVTLIPEFEQGRFTSETPVPTWWPIRERLEIAAKWARDPVLDVGAGTGWLTLHLLEWGHDVTAADYDEKARENFRANAAIVGRDIEIAKEDVSRLSYADEQFASLLYIGLILCARSTGRPRGAVARAAPRGDRRPRAVERLGSFALLNDRDPRTLFRRNRFRGDIRQDVEHFHSPNWWKREFSSRFTVLEVIPLEIFSPLIAKLAGYDVDSRWTRADVRLAAHLPKELASEVIFILRK